MSIKTDLEEEMDALSLVGLVSLMSVVVVNIRPLWP